jgi:hypothetical protein
MIAYLPQLLEKSLQLFSLANDRLGTTFPVKDLERQIVVMSGRERSGDTD